MKTFSTVNTATKILALFFILLIAYGLVTDCPDTAGYAYCSASERWELLY